MRQSKRRRRGLGLVVPVARLGVEHHFLDFLKVALLAAPTVLLLDCSGDGRDDFVSVHASHIVAGSFI
jgi:hypothetical protein